VQTAFCQHSLEFPKIVNLGKLPKNEPSNFKSAPNKIARKAAPILAFLRFAVTLTGQQWARVYLLIFAPNDTGLEFRASGESRPAVKCLGSRRRRRIADCSSLNAQAKGLTNVTLCTEC